ncbi:centromere protein C isoform X1 [Ziziphus jujuba]|uniref:Centromere protein C isoform X1 n=1 Tax=Ziziphus jujuba TaxID=326968 RepID=A0ABM3ILV6_ZIZJJ|nr:centromere protein C isoform X1 [Ziziphus jujuba]
MVTDSWGSDVVDPLQGYWGISLFPKTFGVLPEPSSKPFDPDDDLLAIHSHLKSMALQSPSKLKERAKIILNSGNMSCQASKDKNGTVPAKAEEDPRERRPALGHKRARFSLKPDSREPVVGLEPTLDVKKWKNPEEFFMAYERLENAKREIHKQLGGNQSDSDQHNPSPVASRRRRPGIMRRSTKYKHLYSEDNDNVASSQETFESSILSPSYHSSQRENDKNFTSQEMESAGKTGHMNDEMLEDLLSHNNEVLEGDQVMKLLQHHLHLQIKPLDIDELSLPDIQDISKIGLKSSRENLPKSKHGLPPIDNILKGINTKTPLELRHGTENCSASPTLLKNPFASVALLNRKISLTSPASDPFSPHDIDQLPGTGNCLASPTPPKSPFASPALLNRRISRKSPASNPFAPHDIDQFPGRENCIASCTLLKSPFASPALLNTRISLTSPAREPFSRCDIVQLPVTNPSPIEHIGKQLGSVDVGKQSNKMKPPLNEQDNNIRSHEVAIRDFSQASENCVTEDSSKLGAFPDASSPSYVAVENQFRGSNIEGIVMNENLGWSDAHEDEDTQANRATVEEKIQVEDVPRETVASAQHNLEMMDSVLDNSNGIESQLASPENHTMDGQSGNLDNDAELHNEVIIEEKSRITVDKQSKVKSRRFKGHKEISRRKSLAGTASRENHTADGQSRTPDNDAELHNEIIQEQSRITVNKQSKVKSRPSRVPKDKEISKRKSLAGAGTIWKSGLRRSTRIRTRPLEYWKGERLLYGRIHQSLATVIGLKYASPAKDDGKPTLKVKSFVSDEYKELVELAALH